MKDSTTDLMSVDADLVYESLAVVIETMRRSDLDPDRAAGNPRITEMVAQCLLGEITLDAFETRCRAFAQELPEIRASDVVGEAAGG
jgi:hypothetical protein